jgi:carbon starvation protein
VIQELASTFAPKVSPSALASEAYDFDDNRAGVDRATGAAADGKRHALNPFTWLTNKHGATIFAVILATFIASLPGGAGKPAGTGGLLLWPLFGATNQLLAGLAFLVITFWMWRRNLPVWFIALPMVFMLILPGIAMTINIFVGESSFLAKGNWLLVGIGGATLLLQFWMIIEAIVAWPKARGVLEEQLEPLPVGKFANEGGRSC